MSDIVDAAATIFFAKEIAGFAIGGFAILVIIGCGVAMLYLQYKKRKV